MESSLLEAAETGTAEVEPGGHKLNVSLLQDVLDHLRDNMGGQESRATKQRL